MDQPVTADPVMDAVGAAVEVGRAGDRAGARARFEALWEQVTADGDPFHRCTLAHYAADVQDDPHAELVWDERALAAAEELTDERAQRHHAGLTVGGFLPSLHLNLADVHRRLGCDDRARHHLTRARDRVGALPDDGYGAMIRAGIDRCGERLDLGDRT